MRNKRQVSGITSSYAVLMNDIPAFPLPVAPPKSKARMFPVPVGEFYAQILLWNPEVFPGNPEQWSEGLHVTLWSGGRVAVQRYGSKNGITIWAQTFTGGDGRKYVSFPFGLDEL